MPIVLNYMSQPTGTLRQSDQWALRYVVLLWLSLICMIPFDLAQLDEPAQIGHTANTVETLAKSYLGKAGLEREGASILLARLYVRYATSNFLFGCQTEDPRKDMTSRLRDFLSSCHQALLLDTPDVFLVCYLFVYGIDVVTKPIRSSAYFILFAKFPNRLQLIVWNL